MNFKQSISFSNGSSNLTIHPGLVMRANNLRLTTNMLLNKALTKINCSVMSKENKQLVISMHIVEKRSLKRKKKKAISNVELDHHQGIKDE